MIDFYFLIIIESITYLLFLKHMCTDGIDISIQGRFISLGTLKQTLSFEKLFLIHRWSLTQLPFALCTE